MNERLLSISGAGDDDMRIVLDVRSPIASLPFFEAIVALLKSRLDEVRQPTPGDLEIASWECGADSILGHRTKEEDEATLRRITLNWSGMGVGN